MRYSSVRAIAALVVSLIVSIPFATVALAQQPIRVSERVVVTANRHEEPVDRVASAVTVVTAEQIAAAGDIWLADVLARVPGLTVARTGGAGGVTSVFTRGTNSNHTLVLVDGLKVNAPSTGAFDWANLPASQVERVEIIRGPQSTLYGSNAIGGVINVITRSAGQEPRIELAIDGGSFGTSRGSARVEGAAGALRLALGVEAFNSAGISAADADAGNTETDRFRNLSADLRASYRPDGPLSAELFATAFDGTTRIDGFDFLFGPVDDSQALQDNRDLYGGAAVAYESTRATARITLSRTSKRLAVHNPAGFTTESELRGTINEIDVQADLAHGGGLTTTGLEHRRESAASRSRGIGGTSGFDESVRVTGLYAQHRRSFGDLGIAAGLRHESHGQFGDKTTFRVTAAYSPAASWRAHGSVASGFRAPTFNELYFPGFGNPGLAAETSTGWDIGLGWDLDGGRGELDVTWFRNDLDNLVEFAFPAGFVNLGEAVTQGVELAAGYAAGDRVRFDFTYTFTDAHVQGDDQQLLRRPRHQTSVRVSVRPADRLRILAELRHKGARRDFGLIAPLELPAYTVLGLAAQADLSGGLQGTLRLDNLGDASYQEVWGFGTPGRSITVGLRYRWSAR